MISFWKYAGLITLFFGKGWFGWNLHLFVHRPSHWQIGYRKTWYDGWIKSLGLGPLFLLVWHE